MSFNFIQTINLPINATNEQMNIMWNNNSNTLVYRWVDINTGVGRFANPSDFTSLLPSGYTHVELYDGESSPCGLKYDMTNKTTNTLGRMVIARIVDVYTTSAVTKTFGTVSINGFTSTSVTLNPFTSYAGITDSDTFTYSGLVGENLLSGYNTRGLFVSGSDMYVSDVTNSRIIKIKNFASASPTSSIFAVISGASAGGVNVGGSSFEAWSIVVSGSDMYIGDRNGKRIIKIPNFSSEPPSTPLDLAVMSGASAGGVNVGGINFVPTDLFISGSHMYIADYNGKRIVKIKNFTSGSPTSLNLAVMSGAPAGGVNVGGTDFTPGKITISGSDMYICDTIGNRIIKIQNFSSEPPTSSIFAVISGAPTGGVNVGGSIFFPTDLFISGSHMYVGTASSRIIKIKNFASASPTSLDLIVRSGAPSGGVNVGGTDFNPISMFISASDMYICDTNGKRIIKVPNFSSEPPSTPFNLAVMSGASAGGVNVGGSNFVPRNLFVSGSNIYISDQSGGRFVRVLGYSSSTSFGSVRRGSTLSLTIGNFIIGRAYVLTLTTGSLTTSVSSTFTASFGSITTSGITVNGITLAFSSSTVPASTTVNYSVLDNTNATITSGTFSFGASVTLSFATSLNYINAYTISLTATNTTQTSAAFTTPGQDPVAGVPPQSFNTVSTSCESLSNDIYRPVSLFTKSLKDPITGGYLRYIYGAAPFGPANFYRISNPKEFTFNLVYKPGTPKNTRFLTDLWESWSTGYTVNSISNPTTVTVGPSTYNIQSSLLSTSVPLDNTSIIRFTPDLFTDESYLLNNYFTGPVTFTLSSSSGYTYSTLTNSQGVGMPSLKFSKVITHAKFVNTTSGIAVYAWFEDFATSNRVYIVSDTSIQNSSRSIIIKNFAGGTFDKCYLGWLKTYIVPPLHIDYMLFKSLDENYYQQYIYFCTPTTGQFSDTGSYVIFSSISFNTIESGTYLYSRDATTTRATLQTQVGSNPASQYNFIDGVFYGNGRAFVLADWIDNDTVTYMTNSIKGIGNINSFCNQIPSGRFTTPLPIKYFERVSMFTLPVKNVYKPDPDGSMKTVRRITCSSDSNFVHITFHDDVSQIGFVDNIFDFKTKKQNTHIKIVNDFYKIISSNAYSLKTQLVDLTDTPILPPSKNFSVTNGNIEYGILQMPVTCGVTCTGADDLSAVKTYTESQDSTSYMFPNNANLVSSVASNLGSPGSAICDVKYIKTNRSTGAATTDSRRFTFTTGDGCVKNVTSIGGSGTGTTTLSATVYTLSDGIYKYVLSGFGPTGSITYFIIKQKNLFLIGQTPYNFSVWQDIYVNQFFHGEIINNYITITYPGIIRATNFYLTGNDQISGGYTKISASEVFKSITIDSVYANRYVSDSSQSLVLLSSDLTRIGTSNFFLTNRNSFAYIYTATDSGVTNLSLHEIQVKTQPDFSYSFDIISLKRRPYPIINTFIPTSYLFNYSSITIQTSDVNFNDVETCSIQINSINFNTFMDSFQYVTNVNGVLKNYYSKRNNIIRFNNTNNFYITRIISNTKVFGYFLNASNIKTTTPSINTATGTYQFGQITPTLNITNAYTSSSSLTSTANGYKVSLVSGQLLQKYFYNNSISFNKVNQTLDYDFSMICSTYTNINGPLNMKYGIVVYDITNDLHLIRAYIDSITMTLDVYTTGTIVTLDPKSFSDIRNKVYLKLVKYVNNAFEFSYCDSSTGQFTQFAVVSIDTPSSTNLGIGFFTRGNETIEVNFENIVYI